MNVIILKMKPFAMKKADIIDMKKYNHIHKTVFAVLVMFIVFPLSAQERYTEPVPDEIINEIKFRMRDHILSFKMKMNPNITEEDYRLDPQSMRHPKGVLLNDSTGKYSSFELILDVDRLSPFKSELWDNFYKIKKKGNRFVNVKPYAVKVDGEYQITDAYADTVEFDLGSEYFPFDERFVVYYDSATQTGAWALVGGNIDRYPMYGNYFEFVDLYKWATLRTYQYGTGGLYDFDQYARAIGYKHHNGLGEENEKQGYKLFEAEMDPGFLPTKYALVRVPVKSPYEPVELFYYTNDSTYTGRKKYDGLGKIAKVTYSISSRPKSYKELQPKVEVLSMEESLKIHQDYKFWRKFMERINYEAIEMRELNLKQPIDSIYLNGDDHTIRIVDKKGKETSLADELNVAYEIKVKGHHRVTITEDRKIIYKED